MTHQPSIEELRAELARRLGDKRRAHVESVAATAARVAAEGSWPADVQEAAVRAAWIHDVWKEDPLEAWIDVIASRGWEPDPWAREHAAHLLHGEAAAAWAAEQGEDDPRILSAVRHHPTGDSGWDAVGRILFVADFCEPTREYGAAVGTAAILDRAGQGAAGLEDAARRVLGVRLRWLVEKDRPVHPRSWQAWNAWSLAGAAKDA